MAENLLNNYLQQSSLALNINDALDSSPNHSIYGGPFESNSTIASVFPMDPETEINKKIYVKIIEQPQPKALRFRYLCEGRSAGSIPGVNSTAENKTFPTIKIVGYKGPAFVVVSCVTVDSPHKPHPHNLVGKDGCRKGICTMKINNDSMECMFSNLGIQCVKRKDVEEALKEREDQRVDPFRMGFSHSTQPQNIELNAVRLCFQVFLEGKEKGKFTQDLKPVVSDAIYDKKATSDLNITKLSDCVSSVAGGKEIILLCEKVNKDDIKVRFSHVRHGQLIWEQYGEFQASDVHKQVAIAFKTPKYFNQEIEVSETVSIELVRPSDQSKSEPRPFAYLPLDSGRPFRALKRLKSNYGLFQRMIGTEEEPLRHKKPQVTSQGDPTLSSCGPVNFNKNPQGQSIGDIKRRMTDNLNKNRPTSDHLWAEDTAVYSTNILEDVLSQGSVNEILSAVGGPAQTYEDVIQQQAQRQQLSLAQQAQPYNLPENSDLVYGDTSLASCYSNLEFVLGRAKSVKAVQPDVPPKVIARDDYDTEDFGIYGTPSGLPVHPNKEALLRERGFLASAGKMEATNEDLSSPPVSDILEVDEELLIDDSRDIPKSILDLFV